MGRSLGSSFPLALPRPSKPPWIAERDKKRASEAKRKASRRVYQSRRKADAARRGRRAAERLARLGV